jgi:RNA polymerase sigma-70 factor (ECF subfamily)
LNDLEIIKLILDGDKEKFRYLMEKYHNEMFKYVYNITGDYQDTEDLLQEIFYKIYKNLKKYDSAKASFRTWLYRISKNHVLNYLNSRRYKMKNKIYEYDDSLNSADENIEEVVVKDSQINRIITVMKNILSDKHLQIMQLYYFSELTVKEIAETTAIPEKTIYKAIKSSIEKIKKEVTIDG